MFCYQGLCTTAWWQADSGILILWPRFHPLWVGDPKKNQFLIEKRLFSKKISSQSLTSATENKTNVTIFFLYPHLTSLVPWFRLGLRKHAFNFNLITLFGLCTRFLAFLSFYFLFNKELINFCLGSVESQSRVLDAGKDPFQQRCKTTSELSNLEFLLKWVFCVFLFKFGAEEKKRLLFLITGLFRGPFVWESDYHFCQFLRIFVAIWCTYGCWVWSELSVCAK